MTANKGVIDTFYESAGQCVMCFIIMVTMTPKKCFFLYDFVCETTIEAKVFDEQRCVNNKKNNNTRNCNSMHAIANG